MKTSTKMSPKSLMCLHLIFTSKHFPLNVVILDIFTIKKKKELHISNISTTHLRHSNPPSQQQEV